MRFLRPVLGILVVAPLVVLGGCSRTRAAPIVKDDVSVDAAPAFDPSHVHWAIRPVPRDTVVHAEVHTSSKSTSHCTHPPWWPSLKPTPRRPDVVTRDAAFDVTVVESEPDHPLRPIHKRVNYAEDRWDTSISGPSSGSPTGLVIDVERKVDAAGHFSFVPSSLDPRWTSALALESPAERDLRGVPESLLTALYRDVTLEKTAAKTADETVEKADDSFVPFVQAVAPFDLADAWIETTPSRIEPDRLLVTVLVLRNPNDGKVHFPAERARLDGRLIVRTPNGWPLSLELEGRVETVRITKSSTCDVTSWVSAKMRWSYEAKN